MLLYNTVISTWVFVHLLFIWTVCSTSVIKVTQASFILSFYQAIIIFQSFIVSIFKQSITDIRNSSWKNTTSWNIQSHVCLQTQTNPEMLIPSGDSSEQMALSLKVGDFEVTSQNLLLLLTRRLQFFHLIRVPMVCYELLKSCSLKFDELPLLRFGKVKGLATNSLFGSTS